MHDCRQTRAQLPDLIFNELTTAARQHVLSEIASCADCQLEQRALLQLLGAFDETRAAAQPAEDFWPGYHARLSRRLHALDLDGEDASRTTSAARRKEFALHQRARRLVARAFTARLRVPVPVAIAATLALVCMTVLALRHTVAPVLVVTSAQTDAFVPPRVVEVPVVQEKIVTRTVYVTRKERGVRAPAPQADDTQLAARSRPQDARDAAAPRLVLTGFRPAGDVQLRVIKGGLTHEQ